MAEGLPSESEREITVSIDYGNGDIRPFVLSNVEERWFRWPGEGGGMSGVREPLSPPPTAPSSSEALSIPDANG